MAPIVATEHACTSLLGLVILGLIAWGTWRYGYVRLFTLPLGRLVLGLALLDAIAVAMW